MHPVESSAAPQRWVTKAEAAYQAIRSRILTGSLKPGYAVDQRTLATSLGVSTTPLREAIRRLEAEGFLNQTAHHEIRVSELSLDELRDLYDVRIQLMPYACALAAENANGDDRKRVAELAEFPSAVPAAALLAHHHEFHRAIYSRCPNKTMVDIIDALSDRSNRYRLFLLEDFLATGTPLVMHPKIASAFVGGRADELADLIEADLRTTRQQLVDRISRSCAAES